MIFNKDEILVLVLPGGGLCGVYTIQIMKIINDYLKSLNLPSLHEMTDVYFGTSTGGIIAGGLCGGMSFDKLYDLYMGGKSVFVYDAPWYIPNKLHIPRYKTSVILDILNKNFPNPKLTMGEVFKTSNKHFMLMSVNKNWMKPKNEPMKTWNDNYSNDSVIECISRTFAASVYFGNINDDKRKIVYGDGGEGDSNNPIIEAYSSICKKWPDKKVKLLNIGTGFYNIDKGYNVAKKSNDIQDALKVPMMAKAQSETTAVYMATMLSNRDKNFSFYHINTMYDRPELDVLDGLDYVIDYKNAAIKTMTEDIKKEVVDFLIK